MADGKKQKTKSEEIALAAAKEAIREIKAEEKATRKKQIFQNANVLLEHYLDLKTYCDNAVYSSYVPNEGEDEEYVFDSDGEEITIKSIKASRELTMIFIAHIDMALSLLKRKCELKDELAKYRVIEMLHLDPDMQEMMWGDRILEVCEKVNCSETTVRRWRNEMVKELSVFLFGVNGLRLVI